MPRVTKISYGLFLVCIFAGCAKEYKARRLQPLHNTTQTKEDVTLTARRFDETDQERYFGKKASNIEPIQISIKNDSTTNWIIKNDSVDLPCATLKQVRAAYKTSYLPTFGLSLLFIPLGLSEGLATYASNKALYNDLSYKMLHDYEIIHPNTQRDKLIFSQTHTDDALPFTVKLIDAHDPHHTLLFSMCG